MEIRNQGCSGLLLFSIDRARNNLEHTARAMGSPGFLSCRDEYALPVRRAESGPIPVAVQYGPEIFPCFPLESGLRAREYKKATTRKDARPTKTQQLADRYLADRNRKVTEGLGDFAEQRSHSLVELAFGWLLARPQVANVISGATRSEQVGQNVCVKRLDFNDGRLC